RLRLSVVVLAGRAVGLRQVAAGTTEGEVGHRGLATTRARQRMLDVESNAGGGLEQSAIFTCPARACLNEFSVGFRLRHALRLRRLGLNPNRNRHGAGGRTRCFSFGKSPPAAWHWRPSIPPPRRRAAPALLSLWG